MRAEAEPKPHSRRNESARGAPVARFGAWVGPLLERMRQRTRRDLCPHSHTVGHSVGEGTLLLRKGR
jgi:hypothetical protein